MIVVELDKASAGKGLDPVIESQISQFREVTLEVKRMSPDGNAESTSSAVKVAEHLCDASREIVYRMHRVTKELLEEAAQVFQEAADCILAWKLEKASPEDQKLVQAYGAHIRKRADLLRQCR